MKIDPRKSRWAHSKLWVFGDFCGTSWGLSFVLFCPRKAFDRVRDILRDHETQQGRLSWTILDKTVCRRAWKSLHGMGVLFFFKKTVFSSLN